MIQLVTIFDRLKKFDPNLTFWMIYGKSIQLAGTQYSNTHPEVGDSRDGWSREVFHIIVPFNWRILIQRGVLNIPEKWVGYRNGVIGAVDCFRLSFPGMFPTGNAL